MNKKFRNSLLSLLSLCAIGTVAAGCNSGSGASGGGAKGPEYNFNFDEPLRAECDAFMTIDGKLDEEAWQNQNYLYWVGGKNNEIKATSLFTSKGLYVGLHANDPVIKHSGERYYFAQNSRFRIQVVQEDEINYNGNRGNIHPTRQFWFDIDACDTLSRMERQYDAASYVKGEVNGETEYMSAELFLPWSEMGYKAEELNEAGAPNAVKMLIQYWTPAGTSGFPGFTDDDKFETYYTYDKNGSTCYVDRYSETDVLGYSIGGWTPGDKWEMNEEKTAVTNTVNRTQILWFRQDEAGNAKSSGTHYIASVKVKAKQVSNMYPHVGIMTLANKTTFSIYGASTSSLTTASKSIPVSAARATDGGQWVATKNFAQNFARNVVDGAAETVTVNGVTVAPDEIYLTVVKRGGELYYFANGEYLNMEYDERVSGECVVGLFANGQATLSDWSFKDYSNDPAALDDYLRGYVRFLSTQDNGGGYVVLDRVVAKHGEAVKMQVTPKPGYILTELKFNGEDMYDTFLTGATDATYSYVPQEDLHISAKFSQLPRNAAVDIFFELTDRAQAATKLVGASYVIRGLNAAGEIDNRFVFSGTANSKGNIVGSLLKEGTHELANGTTLEVTGKYTLEIVCNGYMTETFDFEIPANFDGELERVFSLQGYPYGPVTVNGALQNSVGYMYKFAQNEDGTPNYVDANGYSVFSVPEEDYAVGAAQQYMKDSVMTGNFIFNGEISLLENAHYNPDDPSNIWRCGAVVGYVFSTGAGGYIEMKVTAWRNGWLHVNYKGATELAFDNFPMTNPEGQSGFNKKGASVQFTVARYNNVIYVYNCNGELGFTIDKFGIEPVNSKIVEGASKQESFNTSMKTYFNKAEQMAIGMYRMKSAEGGGAYQYKFKYTQDATQLQSQFKAVTLGLKEGVSDYTLVVESKYLIGNGYLKDANVTTNFSGIPASEKNYVLAIEYENGTTQEMFGSYDKAKGTFTATFPLSNNAVVYLKEYDFGPITVNGETVSTMRGVMLTKNGEAYGTKFNQSDGVIQYYTQKTATGNFLADITVQVTEQTPTSGGGPGWAFGKGVGVTLAAGNGKEMRFFTNSWEGTNLLMMVGSTIFKINGFPRDNNLKAVGNEFNFKILRYDNVLYFYNCNNELVFHADQTGITKDLATAQESGTPVARNLIRETLVSMLSAGDEMGFGIYCEYVPKSEGAYDWYVDVENNDSVADDFKASVAVKDTYNYGLTIEKGTEFAGAYMKGAPITVKLSNVPAPTDCATYILAYNINGNTQYIMGEYDKTNGTYTATFALTDTAEVWLEEYDFGAVSANGVAVQQNTNLKLTQETNGAWTTPEDNYAFNLFYADQVIDGDYVINGQIITQSTNWGANANGNIWVTGGGFGFTLSAGGDNWIKLFANAWEQGWFIQTKASGSNAIRVKGSLTMDAMKLQGDDMKFYAIRLDNVIYIYNDQGVLQFHLDANGVTIDNTACTFTHTGTDNAVLNQVNGDIQNFFAAGTQNAIGINKLNGAANGFASYTYDIDVTAGTQYASNLKDGFENRLTTLSSVTINNATLTGTDKVAVKDPFTGEFVYSASAQQQVGFVPNQDGTAMVANGNYTLRLKIGADSGETVFRIFASQNSFVDIWTGVDSHANTHVFFRATTAWWSETRIGYNTGKFANLDGNGGMLDMMIVRANNAFYFYISDYINSTTGQAAKYSKWQLLFQVGEGISSVTAAGYTMKQANLAVVTTANGNFTNNAIPVAKAAQNAFGLSKNTGANGRYSIVLDDSDTRATAFIASPETVA